MDQLFDIKRFYLLLSKHWFENRKAYALFCVTLLAFFIGWFTFILMIGNPYSFGPYNQGVLYFAGLFIAGCLSGSLLFRDFSSKPRKIHYHLLPAATLEKLLCVLFYGVLLFFAGYTLIFYITDYFAVQMANSNNAELFMGHTAKAIEWKQRFAIIEPITPAKLVNIFSPSGDMFIFYPGDNVDLFTAYFPVQASFILGSVYFKKNNFFKTLVVLLLVWLVFFIVEDKVFFPILPANSQTSGLFSTATVTDINGNETFYSLPFWVGDTMTFLLRFALTPALWLATYYRLKEQEI